MTATTTELRIVKDRPAPGMSVRVKVHPGLCEGWGNCHRWAPELYELDDKGLIDLHVVDVPPEMAEAAWLGAQACPAGVITVLAVVDPSDPPRQEETS